MDLAESVSGSDNGRGLLSPASCSGMICAVRRRREGRTHLKPLRFVHIGPCFPIPTHIPIPDSIKVPTVILGRGLLFSILPFLLVPVSHHLIHISVLLYNARVKVTNTW